MKKLFLALLLCVASVCNASTKPEWQSGKLLSYGQNTFETYSQANGSGRETPHTTYSVQIESGGMIYFAERTLNWRWQKFPEVTENGSIKWAFKGKKEILIQDEKGKEFTLTLMKKKIEEKPTL